MTPDEMRAALTAIEASLVQRVTIIRVIVDSNGNEIGRIYRGTFRDTGEHS